jgi:hypothetical protein
MERKTYEFVQRFLEQLDYIMSLHIRCSETFRPADKYTVIDAVLTAVIVTDDLEANTV